MHLYRSHSRIRLNTKEGEIINPYLEIERKPKNSNYVLHKIWGNWFKDKFGIDYRSRALFCTGNYEIAKGYKDQGSSIIILEPMGDYSLVYSNECKDLYVSFFLAGFNEQTEKEAIYNHLNSLNFQHFKNEGLKESAISGSEVMLYANKYKYKIID